MHFERAVGGEQTVRRWVDTYLGFVARALRGAGTPQADVDDAVQRTFIIAARRKDDVRAGAERSFLLQIALNVAAHLRRSAARRREVPESELPERVDATTPEQLAFRKRDRQMIERALETLTPELSAVFVLFELEERTMGEIATLLRIPHGTVASRLRRAREQMRGRLTLSRGSKIKAATLGVGLLTAVSGARAAPSAALADHLVGVKTLVLAASALAVSAAPVLQTWQSAEPSRVKRTLSAALPRLPHVAPAPLAVEGASGPATVEPLPSVGRRPLGQFGRSAGRANDVEGLRTELARLDAARTRLAAGQPAQALALLDAYQRSTPRGALQLEAEVLRIDALARSGRLAQARLRADGFLARHSGSVLSGRVRRIVAQ